MKQIKLFKQNGSWISEETINDKPSAELIKYFGTHLLPTNFTESAPSDQVLATISRLNPDAKVSLK